MIFLIGSALPAECQTALSEYGTCIRLDDSEILPIPVRSHPDMLAAVVDTAVFVGAENKKTAEKLSFYGIDCRVCEKRTGEKYPSDAMLNVLDVGTHLFCRAEGVCGEVTAYAKAFGRIIVSVPQGYTACSTATVGGGIITADTGIYSAALKNGIDGLLISAGDISLPPYKYGFIGGACCETADALIFFGDVTKHRDYAAIVDFCQKHGKKCRSVGDFPLTDFGGARVIKQ